MIDRIKQVIEYSQLSSSAFADTIGISRSGMTHLLTGRNQPSLDVARKILAKYPEISTEWLIMGMGEMTRPDEQSPIHETTPAISSETPEKEYPAENSIHVRQTDLFGEYDNLDDSQDDIKASADVEVSEPIDNEKNTGESGGKEEKMSVNAAPARSVRAQEAPVRVRKSPEPKTVPAPAPVKRERHANNPSQERKLQKIVFFYDDHSFDVYCNV